MIKINDLELVIEEAAEVIDQLLEEVGQLLHCIDRLEFRQDRGPEGRLSLGSAPVPKFFTLSDELGFLTLISDLDIEYKLEGMLILETMHPGAIREWITGQPREKVKIPQEKKKAQLNLSLKDLGL